MGVGLIRGGPRGSLRRRARVAAVVLDDAGHRCVLRKRREQLVEIVGVHIADEVIIDGVIDVTRLIP